MRKKLEDDGLVTCEVLRVAIQEAAPSVLSPRFICSSPLRPFDTKTPSKLFSNDQLKEIKRLKTQLENERHERMFFEAEIKESSEKNQIMRKIF